MDADETFQRGSVRRIYVFMAALTAAGALAGTVRRDLAWGASFLIGGAASAANLRLLHQFVDSLGPGGEPRRRVGEQAEAAQARLALDPGGEVVGQADHLEGRAQHELPGMEHEALLRVDLDQAGEVGLVLGRVDDGVLVVVEEPEELVEADVDAARLDHRGVPRVEPDPAGVQSTVFQ